MKNTELWDPHEQYESVATLFVNRIAMEEDDQFEIHVKYCTDSHFTTEEEIYNAAKEVMLQAQQGSDNSRSNSL